MHLSTLGTPLTVLFLLFNLTILVCATGTQFITGPCTSDADCASACCGFNSGKCAGPVVAQERDGGCGFGNAQPNDDAAQALTGGGQPAATSTAPTSANSAVVAGDGGTDTSSAAAAAAAATTATKSGSASTSINSNLAGSANVGNGQGKQFITGQCLSDADCASGCCGFNSGLCAGAVVAQTRDGGCGFGDAQPNDNAAQALTGGSSGSGTAMAMATAAAAETAAETAAAAAAATPSSAGTGTGTGTGTGAINSSIPGSANVGNGQGKQFITGQCFSDADCASGCCGFKSGLCAGAIIAQTRDGGCGFGNAQPNDNAAKALTRRAAAAAASMRMRRGAGAGGAGGVVREFIA